MRLRSRLVEPEVPPALEGLGPYSGQPVAGVEDPKRLDDHRKKLITRKDDLRTELDQLKDQRGPVWKVASAKRWFPPRGLKSLEVREEAALIDQELYAYLYETDRGMPLDDGYRVSALHRRDERIWSHVLRRERSIMRRVLKPQERFAEFYLRPQRRLVEGVKEYERGVRKSHPVAGVTILVLVFVPFMVLRTVVKIEETIFQGFFKTQKALVDKTVELPILVRSGARETRAEISTQSGRRGLLRAVLDETYLTPERRRVLLFMASVMLAIGWFLAEILIRLTYPEAVPSKQMTDAVLFYAIATRLFLPTPFEIILVNANQVLGFVPTVIIASIGAVIGSWLIFVIGGEANKGIKKVIDRNPILRRSFGWLEANARKFGYPVLGVILAIPFSPDSVPLVLFALLNLELKWFLVTVMVSSVVRNAAFLLLFAN